MNIKDLIKGNEVHFDSYRAGFFYYNIHVWEDNLAHDTYNTLTKYQFTIPVEDIGNATLLKTDKAITYMRWIRKALESKELTKVR